LDESKREDHFGAKDRDRLSLKDREKDIKRAVKTTTGNSSNSSYSNVNFKTIHNRNNPDRNQQRKV
jgi:hypothetical protein